MDSIPTNSYKQNNLEKHHLCHLIVIIIVYVTTNSLWSKRDDQFVLTRETVDHHAHIFLLSFRFSSHGTSQSIQFKCSRGFGINSLNLTEVVIIILISDIPSRMTWPVMITHHLLLVCLRVCLSS